MTHNREDYAVTLYSKADQLKDDRNAELRDIQDAQGLLRFEAKYGAPMLKTYIGMHDLHYSKEKLDDLLSASPSVLRRAMCSCFPEGTYYSLPARPGRKIQTARAAFEMDRGNLAYEQRLQGTAKALRRSFFFAACRADAVSARKRYQSGHDRPGLEAAVPPELAGGIRARDMKA